MWDYDVYVKAAEITSGIRQLLPNVAREILSLLPGVENGADADITILFSDIEGYTSMTERVGDAASLAVLATHDRIVRSALAGHGGREVKHTGDGIMAFFPCAGRAVECALAIQDEISAYNEHRPLEEPLRVAIGINTGSPIRDHGDLYGRAVIVAARAVEIAGGGRVVVTDVVRQLAAGRRIAFEVIPGASLAGLAETPTVYRAVRPPTVVRPDSGDAL